jgi:PilZ domain
MRVPTRNHASLVVSSRGHQTQFPCLIVDVSQEGFRLRGDFRLRRGQPVELIIEDGSLASVRCAVAWVGKTGSGHEGEAGLRTVLH